MSFLQIWIIYSIWGIAIFSAIFAWAVRNRQFSDQDRARYLALRAEKLPDDSDEAEPVPNRLDRYMWVFLLFLCLLVIMSALWLGSHSM